MNQQINVPVGGVGREAKNEATDGLPLITDDAETGDRAESVIICERADSGEIESTEPGI